LGPVVLGRFFDTIGRKPMISFSYLGSAAVAVVLALVFRADVGGEWLFLVILAVCFFLASSGASAAYLTVSEIFPIQSRALARAARSSRGRPGRCRSRSSTPSAQRPAASPDRYSSAG